MNSSKYLYIIDAGHGGLRDGVYTTDPKIGKRWKFEDGFEIFEGVTNRAIATKVLARLAFLEIATATVYDEVEDISLGERVRRVNKLVATAEKPTVFISIHSNAGQGKGFEVFTSVGQDPSDICAAVFCDEIVFSFPDKPLRADKTDGDFDKETNFFVLSTNNKATASLLLENLFFDTREEAEFLLSEEGQQKIADYVCRAVVQIENKILL